MRVERVTRGSRRKRASGGRGRTIAVERFGRIEQALHHLAEARELDAELQLEQRRRGIQMSLSAGRAGVLSSRTMSL